MNVFTTFIKLLSFIVLPLHPSLLRQSCYLMFSSPVPFFTGPLNPSFPGDLLTLTHCEKWMGGRQAGVEAEAEEECGENCGWNLKWNLKNNFKNILLT